MGYSIFDDSKRQAELWKMKVAISKLIWIMEVELGVDPYL